VLEFQKLFREDMFPATTNIAGPLKYNIQRLSEDLDPGNLNQLCLGCAYETTSVDLKA